MGVNNAELAHISHDYAYPVVDLRPGTDLHDNLVSDILECARISFESISRRHETMNKVNNKLTAFIPTSTKEQLMKQRDSRTPVAVVLPHTFGHYDAIATQTLMSFAADDVLHFYQGVGPEDTIGAALLEKVIAQESLHFAELDVRNTQIRDFLAYGFSAVTPVWTIEPGIVTTRKPAEYIDSATGQVMQDYTRMLVEEEEGVLFEGNRVFPINPYYFLPDPTQPIHQVQDMEFVGWQARENISTILERELVQPLFFVNGKYLLDINPTAFTNTVCTPSSDEDVANSLRSNMPSWGTQAYSGRQLSRPVDVIYMYMRIIPSERGLGEGKYPEKWLFAVAGEKILLAAAPIMERHRRFPIAVAAPDTDGYATTPVSRLEITYGCQEAIDFQWNCNAAMLRLAAMAHFLIDPDRVNQDDLAHMHNRPYIRVSRLVMGEGFDQVIKQLTMQTEAAQTLQNIVGLDEWSKTSIGATNTIQGMMRTRGERTSATEFRGTRVSAQTRIDRLNTLFSVQALRPLGYMMAAQTIKHRSKASYVKLIGRYEQELRDEYMAQALRQPPMPGFVQNAANATFFPVGLDDIDCNYDVISSDVTGRGEDFLDTWVQLLSLVSTNPVLGQQVNQLQLLKHIARLAGAKNFSDFIARTPVVGISAPDAEVDEAARKGDLEPIGSGIPSAQASMGGMGGAYGSQ